jgi:hypothetical protein
MKIKWLQYHQPKLVQPAMDHPPRSLRRISIDRVSAFRFQGDQKEGGGESVRGEPLSTDVRGKGSRTQLRRPCWQMPASS